MTQGSRREFLRVVGGGAAALSIAGGAPALARTPEADEGVRPLGYAVVGIGSLAMGEILPGLTKTKRSRLTALVSGHPDKTHHFAQVYGVPDKNIYNYENYDQMASNTDIDVVYVVLPNSMHAEYTIRAAKAGKHVLCEKPMCTSVKDAEAMIAACRETKRRLMVA
jgi:predicted dehydrogenase